MNDELEQSAERLLASYETESIKIHHLDRQPLPSHEDVIRLIGAFHELLFPGYTGAQGLTGNALAAHVRERLRSLHHALTEQINRAFNHGHSLETPCERTELTAETCASDLLARLPDLRHLLAADVRAAYDGDPAAGCFDEIIFSYPGIYAVMVYRLAHELHRLRVPLLPRIMTEHAHHRTGIDIHPATEIGERFFIDHGTGVVIGSTAVIGANVKIYQGVTLGAFSFPKDERGHLIRNTKRHPTIEDDVVIYAGATILGGDTVIGRGSIIGGNVWLTHSVPPETRVLQERPEPRIISPDTPRIAAS